MSVGPDLDLTRRLVDLAESAGPWDDPLPEVRRRAADMASASDPESTGSSVFRTPTANRQPRRWLRSIDLTLVASAAAVVALVAGVGWLLHGSGASSEKASSGGTVMASSAAGAATAPVPVPPSVQSRAGGATPSAAGCAWPAPTSAVTLRAPAQVRSGAAVSIVVRLTGPAVADVYAPLVVVVSEGRVVGRLVVKVIPPGPRLRPSSPATASATLSGTLRRSTCAQALAGWHGPSAAGLALAPGRYQLMAVATASAATVVSAPLTITVIR